MTIKKTKTSKRALTIAQQRRIRIQQLKEQLKQAKAGQAALAAYVEHLDGLLTDIKIGY